VHRNINVPYSYGETSLCLLSKNSVVFSADWFHLTGHCKKWKTVKFLWQYVGFYVCVTKLHVDTASSLVGHTI
jgi:hypothetical protein